MPEYLAPGVYVEEIPSGIKPIEGVSTSTAGFVGATERGPTEVRLVTSFAEFQRIYGNYIDPEISYLPFAIQGFFDNGGKRAFVARVAKVDDATPARVDRDGISYVAAGPGDWGAKVRFWIDNASSVQKTDPPEDPPFRLRVAFFGEEVPPEAITRALGKGDAVQRELLKVASAIEDFDELTHDPHSTQYIKTVVNSASNLIRVDWLAEDQRPRPPNTGPEGILLEGGRPQEKLDMATVVGTRAAGELPAIGLRALELVDQVSILCAPDQGWIENLAAELLIQCENLKDRFAVLQGDKSWRTAEDFVKLGVDSHYSALYHPWVRVYNPKRRNTLLIPPCGHVAGIYARSDIERGVHKAPANEVVRGIVGNGTQPPLAVIVSKGEHDIFNPRGINIIRDFRSDGRGIRVWGARAASRDPEWKYVNVRRLFLFLEESIDEGTQWVVFEPNDDATWAKVRRNITAFLVSVWRSGALFGLTQDEAFFVKCDRTTMTEDDINNGRLICLIGVAPVRPAEFVIFRISQKTALPEV